MTNNPKVKQFAVADPLAVRGLIRCGFELETQSTDGHVAADCERPESEPDEDTISDLARESVENEDARELLKNWGDSYGFFFRLNHRQYSDVCEALFGDKYPNLEKLAEFDPTVDADDILDLAISSAEDHYRENWADYAPENDEGDPSDLFDMPRGMVVETDMSVSGFEFRTDGPQTYAEFLKHANWIFKKDHQIDAGCSFHIHLSVEGVRPLSGKHMIRRLTQFILNHQNELPASVLERFRQAGKNAGRFFRPSAESKGKSSFINQHKQGTWEFRCFGNVKTAKDAKRCLDIAIRALHWAYRVRFELETEPTSLKMDADQWERIAVAAATNNQTIESTAESLGYEIQEAA